MQTTHERVECIENSATLAWIGLSSAQTTNTNASVCVFVIPARMRCRIPTQNPALAFFWRLSVHACAIVRFMFSSPSSYMFCEDIDSQIEQQGCEDIALAHASSNSRTAPSSCP